MGLAGRGPVTRRTQAGGWDGTPMRSLTRRASVAAPRTWAALSRPREPDELKWDLLFVCLAGYIWRRWAAVHELFRACKYAAAVPQPESCDRALLSQTDRYGAGIACRPGRRNCSSNDRLDRPVRQFALAACEQRGAVSRAS